MGAKFAEDGAHVVIRNVEFEVFIIFDDVDSCNAVVTVRVQPFDIVQDRAKIARECFWVNMLLVFNAE